jgi:single-stranded-DNA-specific exonuclease
MKWLPDHTPVNSEVVKEAKELGYPFALCEFLGRKADISDVPTLHQYLDKSISQLIDPFQFSQMKKAVERLLEAAHKGEPVLVYGDFDADGITGSSLLYWGLRKAGITPQVYLPNRFSEGHGLSAPVVEKFASEGIKLLITVDCGMGSATEINLATSLGVDVIVTDHHLPEDDFDALAVINPWIDYPFPHLAGVGVAFKLIQAFLMIKFGENSLEYASTIENLLDLVSIGTIADVVSLTGENRVMVSMGLNHMPQSKMPFLSGFWHRKIGSAGGREHYDEEDVSFYMAPRLNAASRVTSAESAFKFMTSVKPDKLNQYGMELESLNRRRIQMLEQLKSSPLLKIWEIATGPVTVVDTDSSELGLLGLLASSMKSETGRSVIALGRRPDGKVSGSCRAGDEIHMRELLESVSSCLISYGGHKRAAGLALEVESIPELLSALENSLKDFEKCPEEQRVFHGSFEIGEVTEEFMEKLHTLRPFGEGNEKPVFRLENFQLQNVRRVGNGRTLSFKIAKDDCESFSVQGIGFGMGELEKSIRGARYLYGTLGWNYFGSKRNIQFQLIDFSM